MIENKKNQKKIIIQKVDREKFQKKIRRGVALLGFDTPGGLPSPDALRSPKKCLPGRFTFLLSFLCFCHLCGVCAVQ